MSKIKKWHFLSVLGLLFVLLLALISIAPFVYMLLASFTDSRTPVFLPNELHLGDFSNYTYVFRNNDFLHSLINSVIVVGLSCAFNCLLASMAAYGFEKKNFPFKEGLYLIYLATMMIPGR